MSWQCAHNGSYLHGVPGPSVQQCAVMISKLVIILSPHLWRRTEDIPSHKVHKLSKELSWCVKVWPPPYVRPQWHHSSWGLEAPGLRKCVAIQADSLLSLQAAAHRYGAEMLQITTLTALCAFTGEGTLQKVKSVFNINTFLLRRTLLQSQWLLILQ